MAGRSGGVPMNGALAERSAGFEGVDLDGFDGVSAVVGGGSAGGLPLLGGHPLIQPLCSVVLVSVVGAPVAIH